MSECLCCSISYNESKDERKKGEVVHITCALYFKSSEAMQQLCERIGEDFQQIMMSILVCCSHTGIL